MTRVLIFLVHTYRLLISPWLAPRCRFVPTCSEYAVEALKLHGAWRGGWLALRRVGRCHPFGGSGIDEVPPKHPSGRSPSASCCPSDRARRFQPDSAMTHRSRSH